MGFLVDTDASIVKDYQERLKKIDKLNQERGTDISRLADLKSEIAQKKEEWLQPLKSLIDRINKNFGTFFENMGCAGEVSLCHSEDEVCMLVKQNFISIYILLNNIYNFCRMILQSMELKSWCSLGIRNHWQKCVALALEPYKAVVNE